MCVLLSGGVGGGGGGEMGLGMRNMISYKNATFIPLVRSVK